MYYIIKGDLYSNVMLMQHKENEKQKHTTLSQQFQILIEKT